MTRIERSTHLRETFPIVLHGLREKSHDRLGRIDDKYTGFTAVARTRKVWLTLFRQVYELGSGRL